MSNMTDRNSLGMKWYTFYVKVRPWIGLAFFLLSAFTYGETFLTLMNTNLVGAAFAIPTIIYVASYVAYTIANLVLFFKERNESGEALLGFIKGLLIFEVFYIPYGSILGQYYEGQSIIVSIIVLLIMMALCYFVWYRLNIKYFRKRLAPWELNSTMTGTVSEAPKITETGTYSLSHANEVPKQYGSWNVMGSDLKLEKSDAVEVPETPAGPDPKHQEIPVVTKAVEQRTSYAKYCPKCGNGIDPASKVCTGCGKQYFKGVPWKTLGAVVAIVLLVASIGLNAYMYSDYTKAQETIAELTKKNDNLTDNIADLKKENEQYYDYWVDTFDKMDVFDSWIVFIENDGTNLYHKYDCSRFLFEDSWAHNIEYAEYIGYSPCPRCFD